LNLHEDLLRKRPLISSCQSLIFRNKFATVLLQFVLIAHTQLENVLICCDPYLYTGVVLTISLFRFCCTLTLLLFITIIDDLVFSHKILMLIGY